MWGAVVAAILLVTPSVPATVTHAAFPSPPNTTIVPGVGIGGVSLGATRAEVHARVGRAPEETGLSTWGLSSEFWSWPGPGSSTSYGPDDQLTVYYAYNGNAPGPVAYIATPGAWGIPGTAFVSWRAGDLSVLRRTYGERLKGPYRMELPYGQSGGSERYYELRGLYRGRPVHTLFGTSTQPSYANEILWVSVSFCGSKDPRSLAPLDQRCH